MAIHEICPTCTRPGTHICTGCRDIKYCSLECQETDRLAHKLLCGKFRELAERPGDHMRRVRFFPDEGTKPVLLWKEVLDYEVGLEVIRPAVLRSSQDPEISRKNADCGRTHTATFSVRSQRWSRKWAQSIHDSISSPAMH